MSNSDAAIRQDLAAHAAEGDTVILADPKGIEMFQLLSMKGRLELEVKTGIKFGVSTLSAVNRKYGTKFRTKKQAINFIEDIITDEVMS